MAAAGGHAKIVKILLENGANPEDENAVCVFWKVVKSLNTLEIFYCFYFSFFCIISTFNDF